MYNLVCVSSRLGVCIWADGQSTIKPPEASLCVTFFSLSEKAETYRKAAAQQVISYDPAYSRHKLQVRKTNKQKQQQQLKTKTKNTHQKNFFSWVLSGLREVTWISASEVSPPPKNNNNNNKTPPNPVHAPPGDP